MGTIKDRNHTDLTEAGDNQKWWKEYTEELYKKDVNDPDNHDGVITHLKPNILESQVKWALGSITANKASGGDGISAELFHFFDDLRHVGNLISGSYPFSKSSLNIWKFTVHVLLKPGLENFEHYFAGM